MARIVKLAAFACLSMLVSTLPAFAQRLYFGKLGGDQIYSIGTNGAGLRLEHSGLTYTYGIAIDPNARLLYWCDSGGVHRAPLGSSANTTIVSESGGSNAIALDLAAGKVYWTNYLLREVERANLDGSSPQVLYTQSSATSIEGIAVDHRDGYIFFVIPGTGILRADLNGAGTTVIVPDTTSTLRDVQLDLLHDKVYWTAWFTKSGSSVLRRSNLDGSGVETIVTNPFQEIWGIALNPASGLLYYTSPYSQAIHLAQLDGTNDQVLASGLVFQPGYIALDPGPRAIPMLDPRGLLALLVALAGLALWRLRAGPGN